MDNQDDIRAAVLERFAGVRTKPTKVVSPVDQIKDVRDAIMEKQGLIEKKETNDVVDSNSSTNPDNTRTGSEQIDETLDLYNALGRVLENKEQQLKKIDEVSTKARSLCNEVVNTDMIESIMGL